MKDSHKRTYNMKDSHKRTYNMKDSHKLKSRSHVLRLALRGFDMSNWYSQAEREIQAVAELEGWSAEYFADIIAMLSPRASVRRNIRAALVYIGQDSQFLRNTLPTVIRSVETYHEDKIIRGGKTSCFARALQGDKDAITLDTWISYAMQDIEPPHIKYFSRIATRQAACRMITEIAESLSLSCRACQAAIWCGILLESGQEPQYFPIMQEYDNWIAYDRVFPLSGVIPERELEVYDMESILQELAPIDF